MSYKKLANLPASNTSHTPDANAYITFEYRVVISSDTEKSNLLELVNRNVIPASHQKGTYKKTIEAYRNKIKMQLRELGGGGVIFDLEKRKGIQVQSDQSNSIVVVVTMGVKMENSNIPEFQNFLQTLKSEDDTASLNVRVHFDLGTFDERVERALKSSFKD